MAKIFKASLTSYDSDYNYDYRVKYLSENNKQQPKEIKSTPQFLDHKRHKTGNVMRILKLYPSLNIRRFNFYSKKIGCKYSP